MHPGRGPHVDPDAVAIADAVPHPDTGADAGPHAGRHPDADDRAAADPDAHAASLGTVSS